MAERKNNVTRLNGRPVNVRLTHAHRTLIERAAQIDHRKLSDFVRVAALERAEEIVKQCNTPGLPEASRA
ncbi:MAG: DUF1778 domain-containing protein [Desulfarculaceae bacterium]|nr:DUF1778 domain-containing protein [Desulfarculaceae bacterium]MCF8073259.1 DUF1778 domain-containing protein [Desulfarculaceae bacterium]MCF8100855.1 DUF1778 domain-containing protein [Desulfarculaceae bacterium]